MLFSERKFSSQSFTCPPSRQQAKKCLLWIPPTPKPLALLTGTQLPSFHSHKLVPTSDKSPESPTISDRAVGTGGAGGAIDRKDFDRSVDPISNKGKDYAHHNNTRPLGFSDLPESPTTSDELKSAALSNEVSNTNSLSPSTTAVFKLSLFIYFYRLFLDLF